MNIIISEQTKNFLKKKNINCLTLNMVVAKNGCCGGYAIPQVIHEEPADASRYYHTLIDKTNLFIHKTAIEDDIKLEFILRKFLLHEYVDVDGVRVL